MILYRVFGLPVVNEYSGFPLAFGLLMFWLVLPPAVMIQAIKTKLVKDTVDKHMTLKERSKTDPNVIGEPIALIKGRGKNRKIIYISDAKR